MDNPLSEEELLNKFRTNASNSLLPTGQVEKIIEKIRNIESLSDVTELTGRLTVG